jgi:FkbM family methyltransferase
LINPKTTLLHKAHPAVTQNTNLFDDLFAVIPQLSARHAPSDPLWRVWRAAARPGVEASFRTGETPQPFGPFGSIALPYFKMGAIDSLDLFGLDELIIFSFYHANRARYRKVVDFGANIGLHSIMLSRCGFEVRSFEPDPIHLERLKSNLSLNGEKSDVHAAAISLEAGTTEFVRVVGNTTGSHIKGAKTDAYGPMDLFEVKLEAAAGHLAWADLAKIDIEGHEATLLTGLPTETWRSTDAMLEIGSEANAQKIFEYFKGSDVNLFAQKIGWRRVTSVSDMPTSHRDGSLFLTSKPEMIWIA